MPALASSRRRNLNTNQARDAWVPGVTQWPFSFGVSAPISPFEERAWLSKRMLEEADKARVHHNKYRALAALDILWTTTESY